MEENRGISEAYIKDAMTGDEDAFTWLYKQYHQKVYFFAMQFFRKEDIAEDIVQEVFIKVYQKIDTLQSPSAFISWLHVVTYRVCCNYNRSKIELTQLEEESTADHKTESASDQLEKQRIYGIIAELIDEKSLPLRLVGQMSYLEGMKSVEIAKVLGIPNVTVRTRLKRLRHLLQEDLKKHGISQNSYSFVLLSPIVLHEAYKVLCSEYVMRVGVSKDILGSILVGGGISKNMVAKGSLKKWIYGGISVVMIGGIVAWQLWQPSQSEAAIIPIEMEKPTIVAPIEEEMAKITTITYDTGWTNKEVKLDIATTNGNYDKITIDDIDTLEIANNGTYKVRLVKEGKVIDEKEVSISNIDRYSPTAYSETGKDTYYFYLSDDVSGINKESLEYVKNGVTSLEYKYIENENMLIVSNDGVSSHEIYISDNAGNVFTITIK